MRFIEPTEFDIPDEWLDAAGLNGFTTSATSYRVTRDPK